MPPAAECKAVAMKAQLNACCSDANCPIVSKEQSGDGNAYVGICGVGGCCRYMKTNEKDGVEKIQVRWEDDGTKSPSVWSREDDAIKVSDLDEPLAGGWLDTEVSIGREAFAAACHENRWSVDRWFEVLRLELERDNIHVLMVYPSFLDTPIEHNALGKDGKPASHARSMVGGMRTPEWMVGLVDQALAKQQRWLLPEPVSRFGSLLWRFAPALYLRQVRKRFAGELG